MSSERFQAWSDSALISPSREAEHGLRPTCIVAVAKAGSEGISNSCPIHETLRANRKVRAGR